MEGGLTLYTANRIESVAFTEPGTYLVICNVTPHFLDGMYAWVKVTRKDDD
jgi:plastocyanin